MNTAQNDQNININLLNADNFSNTTIGKILTWALSIGRYIVVFTELVVILSFLSRFKLDRDLTDLNEEITKQQAIINSYGDLENKFTLAQQKIEVIKSYTPPVDYNRLIQEVHYALSPDTRAIKMLLTDEAVQLSLETLSLEGFHATIKNFQSSQMIDKISLGKVENAINNQIKYEIKLDLIQQ